MGTLGKALIGCLLTTAASVAYCQQPSSSAWERVGETETHEYFTPKAAAQRNRSGNVLQWTLGSRKPSPKLKPGQNDPDLARLLSNEADSFRLLYEVDCRELRLRSLQLQAFGSRMGAGKPLDNYALSAEQREWAYAAPETVESLVIDLACKQ